MFGVPLSHRSSPSSLTTLLPPHLVADPPTSASLAEPADNLLSYLAKQVRVGAHHEDQENRDDQKGSERLDVRLRLLLSLTIEPPLDTVHHGLVLIRTQIAAPPADGTRAALERANSTRWTVDSFVVIETLNKLWISTVGTSRGTNRDAAVAADAENEIAHKGLSLKESFPRLSKG